MSSNDTDIGDFEARLRGELRRRADQLVLDDLPEFRPSGGRARGPVAGAGVAVAVVAIVLAAALVTNHFASRSAGHLRARSSVSTPAAGGDGSPLHFTITLPGARLRAAQDLSDSGPIPDPTFATVTYRMPGALRAPIVYATLTRISGPPPESDPRHHPLYHPLDVGGRDGYIVWLGGDVADLVVRVDDAHTLDLSSWGLTQDQLVRAAAGVVVLSDTSFELPGLPTGLQAAGAAPGSEGDLSRAEFSTNDGTVLVYDYSGGLESRLGVLLYPGSGTWLGRTTIERISVDGRAGLLRIDRLESPNTIAGQQPLSFDAVWDAGSDQAGEVTGGAPNTIAVSDILDAVARIDDTTWQNVVAQCPWPTGGTDTAYKC